MSEAQVISLMRHALKPSSFRRWRRRVSSGGLKHAKRFRHQRRRERRRNSDDELFALGGESSWDDQI